MPVVVCCGRAKLKAGARSAIAAICLLSMPVSPSSALAAGGMTRSAVGLLLSGLCTGFVFGSVCVFVVFYNEEAISPTRPSKAAVIAGGGGNGTNRRMRKAAVGANQSKPVNQSEGNQIFSALYVYTSTD